MLSILNTFAKDFLLVASNVPRLVPQLRQPYASIFCYQDYQPGDRCFVAFDIFTPRNADDHYKTFTMNTRFLNEHNKVAYSVHQNQSLIQIMDLISMYDGRGSWNTQCGLLVEYVFDNDDDDVKLKQNANFKECERCLECNQCCSDVIRCIQQYYVTVCNRDVQRNYCLRDDCANRVSGACYFCFLHKNHSVYN